MIKILIADDHPIVRVGIKRIIEDAPDMQCIAEVDNGDDVLIKIRKHDIDLLLLDISMPGPGFCEIMRRLEKHKPHLRILILSTHPEEQYAIRALKAGANGYLTKDHSSDELISAIRTIHSGQTYISSTMGEHLVRNLTSNEKIQNMHDSLSEREDQILRMLGQGMRTNDIANRLSLSPKTISTYKARIFEKMNFNNTAELVIYVVDNNLGI